MEPLITALIAAGAAVTVAWITRRTSPRPEIARVKDYLDILQALPEDSIMHVQLLSEVDVLIERMLAKSVNILIRIAFFSGITSIALISAMIYEDLTLESLLPMERVVWGWTVGALFVLFAVCAFLGMGRMKSNRNARVEQLRKRRSLIDRHIRTLLETVRADESPTDPLPTRSGQAPDG